MRSPRPELHLLGISFRTAAQEVREGLAWSPSQASGLLAEARSALPGVEAVVLSTCNRTEFYLSGLAEEDLLDGWHALLRRERGCADVLEDSAARYRLRGQEAYRHLLRVACGLDSALLGDGQVLGQLRRAVAVAQGAGTLGGVLAPATADALRTGRRARRETTIGAGAPGVGGAVTAALAARGVADDARVLVVGTGEAARAVTRALVKAGRRGIEVVGRNAEAARTVATAAGATTASWAGLDAAVAAADAVVVVTAADRPVLRSVPPGPSLVVDAGFPRQVADDVARPGLEVVSLLALTEQADAAAELRRAAVPEVESLVAEQVATWSLGRDRADLEDAIKQLHTDAAQVARETALRLAPRSELTPEELEQVLGREVRRLLHGHVSRLRGLTAVGGPPT